jgi:hypothetical protein
MTGEQIGYLSRTCAEYSAADLDSGTPRGAVIAEIRGGSSGWFGVVLWMTAYSQEYEPDEVRWVEREPTRVADMIARIVCLGGEKHVSQVWRDGAWQRPGPDLAAFKGRRRLKPDEIVALGIPAQPAPVVTSIEPMQPIGYTRPEDAPLKIELKLDLEGMVRDAVARDTLKHGGR